MILLLLVSVLLWLLLQVVDTMLVVAAVAAAVMVMYDEDDDHCPSTCRNQMDFVQIGAMTVWQLPSTHDQTRHVSLACAVVVFV